VNGHVVVVKRARLRARQSDRAEVHVLTTSRHVVDFVYYQLGDDDFLFVPWAELPAVGTTFLDRPGSKYQRYRNTFAAADLQTDAAPSVN
jgi:hypothetical protein